MASFLKHFKKQANKTSIGGIKFVAQSESKVERIFWICIITLGLVVVSITIRKQVNTWLSMPIALSTSTTKLKNVPYPAVTFCNYGWNKFGIMEHLINMMEPKEAHEKFALLRRAIIKQMVYKRGAYAAKPVDMFFIYKSNCIFFALPPSSPCCVFTIACTLEASPFKAFSLAAKKQ